jgi:heat-inducible transcriptional repressor
VDELTERKRGILRTLVEEYIATGQPVGSRSLLERSGLNVSSSTVRHELAELEALGLLTHPHTSAGRVPTDNGYRLYADELVLALEGRPGPPPVDLSAMRNELETALRHTTDALSQATRLLALVSAPSLEATTVRHVELLLLQQRVVIVVVITSAGDVTKRRIELADPSDPGLVDWARAYLNETVAGLRLGAAALRRRFEDASLSTRELAFLDAIRPAFIDVIAETATQVYVGGAAGLFGDAKESELDAVRHLLELLEHRASLLALLTDAIDPHRTVVRVGPELEGATIPDVSYVASTYGLPNRSLGSVGLLGPLRMDYDKAIRSVRGAAYELSRLVESLYDED